VRPSTTESGDLYREWVNVARQMLSVPVPDSDRSSLEMNVITELTRRGATLAQATVIVTKLRRKNWGYWWTEEWAIRLIVLAAGIGGTALIFFMLRESGIIWIGALWVLILLARKLIFGQL